MSDYSREPSGFRISWFFISMLIFFVSQIIVNIAFGVFGILTLGVGFILYIVAKPVAYFIGGFITGVMSPGITIREPAMAALVITVLGFLFDSTAFVAGHLLVTIIAAIIAYGAALMGARLGEGVD